MGGVFVITVWDKYWTSVVALFSSLGYKFVFYSLSLSLATTAYHLPKIRNPSCGDNPCERFGGHSSMVPHGMDIWRASYIKYVTHHSTLFTWQFKDSSPVQSWIPGSAWLSSISATNTSNWCPRYYFRPFSHGTTNPPVHNPPPELLLAVVSPPSWWVDSLTYIPECSNHKSIYTPTISSGRRWREGQITRWNRLIRKIYVNVRYPISLGQSTMIVFLAVGSSRLKYELLSQPNAGYRCVVCVGWSPSVLCLRSKSNSQFIWDIVTHTRPSRASRALINVVSRRISY